MSLTRRHAVLAGIAATCSAPWLRTQAASASWLIGQSAPQNGVVAASSAETTLGARLYFSGINARGGVHGRPIELLSLDDGQDPKRTVANTQQLLDRGVIALGLYRTAPSAEAALPLVHKAGIAFIGTQTGSSLLYDPVHATVFNTHASYHDEVARAVNFFTQLGLMRVAALVASDAFGQDVLVGLRRAMAKAKAELVAQASFDNRSTDVSAQLEQIRKANPQVVILVSNARASAEFIKRAREADFKPTFVSLSNTSAMAYVTELGNVAEGKVVTQVVPSPYSGRVRVVAEFRDAVAQAGQAAPPVSHSSLLGFLSAKLMHEGIRRAGPKADREQLVQAINAAGRIDLGDYALSYAADSRQGSRLAELTVIGKDGRFMF